MNSGLKMSREKLYQKIWKNNIPIPSSKWWMTLECK